VIEKMQSKVWIEKLDGQDDVNVACPADFVTEIHKVMRGSAH